MSAFELNPGMFIVPRITPVSAWTGHIPVAGWLISALRPRLLVELGTHAGASFFAFCQATRASGHEGRCYAVDTWQGDQHAGHYDDGVYFAVRDHLAEHYAGFASMMRMTFDEAVPYFSDGSVDLLHIDGLHTYEAVRHDFETWLPKISERGVILFHDTCVRERDFGVWKLWAELKEIYPSFEFTHTHGLGILGVGVESRPLLQSLWSAAESGEAAASVNALFEFLGNGIVRGQQVGDLLQRQIHLDGDNGHLRNLLGIRDSEHAAREAESAERLVLLEGEKREIEARLQHELGLERDLSVSLRKQLSEVGGGLSDLTSRHEETLARSKELEGLLDEQTEFFAQQTQDAAEREARLSSLERTLTEARQRLAVVEGSVGWRISSLLGRLLGPSGDGSDKH